MEAVGILFLAKAETNTDCIPFVKFNPEVWARPRNRMMKILKQLLRLSILGVMLLPVSLQGAVPQCFFETYSTLNGMTHNRVSDIYTDSEGFVWICTWYGVSRFDGYTFKNYSTTPDDTSPLSHNRFLSVSEDANSHLWFKIYNHHIYRFNRQTEQFEDPVALLEGVNAKHYRASFCLHDERGSTWVAIPGVGLVRFDGERGSAPLKVGCWLRDADLVEGISALMIDRGQTLWVATRNAKLYRVDPDALQAEPVLATASPIEWIEALGNERYFMNSNELWCVSSEKGSTPRRVEGLSDFTALDVDTVRRKLYAGNRRGELAVLQAGESRLRRLTPSGDRLQRIRALKSDSKGLLWITTPEAGITRYNPERDDCKHFEQKPYTVSYNVDTLPRIVEAGGRLWIKMNQYGFGYYDRETDCVEPFYNDPSRPECLMTNAVVRFEVRDDVLWLSTYYERGLRCAVLLDQPAEVLEIDTRFEDEIANEIRALMADRRGRVWVGTKTGELLCYSADHRLLHSYPDDRNRLGMVYALKEDSRGAIWVGTRDKGLYRMEPEGDHYRITAHYCHNESDPCSLSCDHIYSIEEDDSGRIWVATYGGGINLYDPATESFLNTRNRLAHYPLEEADRVRWLLNDGQGRMLAATVDGLVLFTPERDPRSIRFDLVQKVAGDSLSLGNNDIIHMTRDSRGRIWLATYGGGLNRIEGYDSQGMPRFRRFDTEAGLPGNISLSVTEDALGHIWVATQNAVSCFDEEQGLFSNYLLYDNHTSASLSEATVLSVPGGRVLFGGGRNLYAFDPKQPPHSRRGCRLRFTGLMVDNQPAVVAQQGTITRSITSAERIDLHHDYSNFRIDFAALNFAMQEEIGYMYKLEGYDQDWNVAGRMNSATYSNVPKGRYTFRVKAYVGSVAAIDEERQIEVVIHPPFWLSWWAQAIYLLLAVLVIVLIGRVVGSMQRMRREAHLEQEMTDLKLQFFTNISHELRTPLTLILGGIEEVRKHDELSQRGRMSLNLAHKNTRRMLSLINQLLDFRKIVKNKMELKISHVNLVQLVEDAVEDFREMASERHIELLFTVSRRSILVWVDLERMESVVYNLLSNAFKFTRNGGRIEVILKANDAEEQVLMTVRDNGIGIAREQQNAIFERFHQASRSIHGQKGSGIGLSLCRDIINLHQGEISVESRPGEGSAFTVKLCMGNAHFGMEQINFGDSTSEKRPELMVSDYVSGETERRLDITPPQDSPLILLVDDNRELRIFMYNSLIENYRVIEAEDGVEALAAIKREMPDIVVTDLMMPNMDGIELVNRVRNDFSISHIPIIMLTARHSPDERIKAMEYGADGYITKPFSIDLLQARIDNLLTQRRTLFEKFSTSSARNQVVKLEPQDVVVTDKDEAFINNVMNWLSENIENSDLTIDQLASHLGLGRTTMYNKLKSLTGKSPVELIKEYRINKSRLLLRTGQFAVSEVAYKVGFSDPGYFSRCFREQFNMSPAEYLKSHNLKHSNENQKQQQPKNQ